MATYNGAKFIREQLDSIARQTVLPMELVVTDDGSTDNTLEIVEAFAQTAPFPVRASRNPKNLGYANNFMRAALSCEGDLIAFCDQDDLWLENKLETCAAAFDDAETLLCVHSADLWDGQTRSGQRCPGYDERSTFKPLGIYPLQSSYGFAMVVRREIFSIADNEHRFQKALPPALCMPHDQWCWFLASIFGNMVLLPDILVLYRQHGGNVFGGSINETGISGVVAVRDYEAAALAETRAAAYLNGLAAQCAEKWKPRARAGAALMARCGQINTLRAKIHRADSSLPGRFSAFLSIVLRTRYAVNQPGARQGVRAAIKDLLLGVTGIQRKPA